MNAVLEVRGLEKAFGGIRAVDGVSFEVREGEILGLIGPNGSGKSTIFNLIAGALRPNEGSIRFRGREIAGDQLRHHRGIGQRGVHRPLGGVEVLGHQRLVDADVRAVVEAVHQEQRAPLRLWACQRRLLDPQIGGTMAWTLFLGVISFTLLYAWLMAHRFRLAWLEDYAAMAERAGARVAASRKGLLANNVLGRPGFGLTTHWIQLEAFSACAHDPCTYQLALSPRSRLKRVKTSFISNSERKVPYLMYPPDPPVSTFPVPLGMP